jgi:hypothetical protein
MVKIICYPEDLNAQRYIGRTGFVIEYFFSPLYLQ